MNAVSDCLLTPIMAPESGSDTAVSEGAPDPEAFERELREAGEIRPEDAPEKEMDESPAPETPEQV